MPSRYAASDYAAGAAALMPTGRVWPTDQGSQIGAFLSAIGQTFARSDEAASDLLDGSLPGNNPDLLVEWEEALGLPDPCAGINPTIPQRARQVQARFIAGGGQSRQRFIDYAAALGFTIQIANYAPFRAGRSSCIEPCADAQWTFVWGVQVISNAGGLSPRVLMCELNAIKPAETTILMVGEGAAFLTEDGLNAFVSETGDTFVLES